MSQQTPLITILTPTYNHERYLKQCLDSVVAQTEDRWEQIIIDDGSDDRTGAIALGYADSRIRYVRQENAGIYRLAQTLNQALAAARGEFIALVSGDDFWPSDKLESQLPAFDDAAVVLSWGRAAVVDAHGDPMGLVPSSGVIRRSQRRTRGETFLSLLERNTIYAATVMIRRDALLDIGGFQQPDGIPIEDWLTYVELSRHGRFAVTDAILGYYRRHETQVSAVMKAEMAEMSGWLGTYAGQLTRSECQELGVRGSKVSSIADRKGSATNYVRGKQLLRDGDQREGRLLLLEALRVGRIDIRVRALMVLALTRLGVDPERVSTTITRVRRASFFNRATSSVERRSRGGTAVHRRWRR